ncbi:class I SAM-dependent methyltransferase [Candidatus Gracilibacteria bacterium]|nr:class I SAM-dependent methyltransferase [Candidatus Gracilibacteria bacterium]
MQSGNFGKHAKEYESARPRYPAPLLAFIASQVSIEQPRVLDLGCGTGISTRQLAETISVQVIGCDIDSDMLDVARQHTDQHIVYCQCDARTIPYPQASFDLVTAFTAFHWFTDQAALVEIRRVLKPGGLFCTVQPRHTSPFSGDLRMILSQELQRPFEPSYSNIDFKESLTSCGFTIVQQKIYQDSQHYTLDQYMTLLQSYSVWNQVPSDQSSRLLTILKNHFATKIENGFVRDARDIEVLIATLR